MKLILHLPSSIESDIKYDPNSRTIILRPLYNAPYQPVGYVSVVGEKGKTRAYRLSLTPRSGKLGVHEMVESSTDFDSALPGEAILDDEGKDE